MSALDFLILALATWRLSHMVALEPGPVHVFERLRVALGAKESLNTGWQATGFWSELVLCPLCLSVWLGALCFALWLLSPASRYVFSVLALSGLACAIELGVRRS